MSNTVLGSALKLLTRVSGQGLRTATVGGGQVGSPVAPVRNRPRSSGSRLGSMARSCASLTVLSNGACTAVGVASSSARLACRLGAPGGGGGGGRGAGCGGGGRGWAAVRAGGGGGGGWWGCGGGGVLGGGVWGGWGGGGGGARGGGAGGGGGGGGAAGAAPPPDNR